ncbi:MAG TPA: FkbM family methyltransferase [Bryobacteraceae bacterium]|nr:FkbM family methyltransferase [Bryobacteraceae bacterium]
MPLKIGLALVGVALMLAAISPRARLFAVWLVGRTEGCSLDATLNANTALMRFTHLWSEMGGESRIVEREPSGFELVTTSRGQYWTSRHEPLIGFLLAEQETQIYGDHVRGVRPGDIVLDCGADIGVFTRSALFRGAKLVVAIEPAPPNVESLRRTFAREIAEGRVIVYPKGVWDREDTLDLNVSQGGTMSGGSVVYPPGPLTAYTVKVPLTTIDLMVKELGLPRVDFIKMDIEGAEKNAIRGGAETIRKFHPRMALSTEHLPDDAVAIPRTVQAIRPDYRSEANNCKDRFDSIESNVLLFQ